MSTHEAYCRVIKSTPVGDLLACVQHGALTRLDFINTDANKVTRECQKKAASAAANCLFAQVEAELAAYFSGQLQHFTVPVLPTGTAFQREVWAALQGIPYGETWSYKMLAEAVNRPKGYQAVGQANGKNPISIIIPCHRVIAADGTLGGYGGGLERKTRLLNMEKVQCR